MVATAKQPRAAAVSVGERRMADERVEIVGHLQRSLALLRGCDSPGIKAQITGLLASLRTRLEHIAGPHPAEDGTRFPARPLIPAGEAALDVTPLECRAYAIQCESLASMATDPQQRDMLRALARLWRGLATGQ